MALAKEMHIKVYPNLLLRNLRVVQGVRCAVAAGLLHHQ